jgi:hypothetical protein
VDLALAEATGAAATLQDDRMKAATRLITIRLLKIIRLLTMQNLPFPGAKKKHGLPGKNIQAALPFNTSWYL